MSKLWKKSSRQWLPGGSLFPQRRASSTARRLQLPSAWTRLPVHAPSSRFASPQTRRQLVTLAIETSCDDTCVAVLEKNSAGFARLHFNEKITSDNRAFHGIHPLNAVVSHSEHLAPLVREALRALPKAADAGSAQEVCGGKTLLVDGCLRVKPDFVSVTRGPGMQSNLATGLNVAKGLAIAWDVPLLAVNHMQAHALTPQLVGALRDKEMDQARDRGSEEAGDEGPRGPRFPFLSLLVSGGHTILEYNTFFLGWGGVCKLLKPP
ncbi:hypothetical protein F4803DRAFT_96923 [Xylaria telfairii]|nr:hypothetical protein F4803DRAFT_96923 [Xylaria telfairii]